MFLTSVIDIVCTTFSKSGLASGHRRLGGTVHRQHHLVQILPLAGHLQPRPRLLQPPRQPDPGLAVIQKAVLDTKPGDRRRALFQRRLGAGPGFPIAQAAERQGECSGGGHHDAGDSQRARVAWHKISRSGKKHG